MPSRRSTLLTVLAVAMIGVGGSLALAPDDRKLAIHYAPGSDLERVLVIDEHGEAVADLAIGDQEKAVADGVAERSTAKPTLEETPDPQMRNHLAPVAPKVPRSINALTRHVTRRPRNDTPGPWRPIRGYATISRPSIATSPPATTCKLAAGLVLLPGSPDGRGCAAGPSKRSRPTWR